MNLVSKIVLFLWIIFGLFLILSGSFFLYQFNRPGVLTLVSYPNYLSVSQIIIGIYAIFFAIKTFQQSNKLSFITVMFYSLIVSIPVGSIIHTIYLIVVYKSIYIPPPSSILYLLILPFISLTVKLLNKQNSIFILIKTKETYLSKKKETIFYSLIFIVFSNIISAIF